MSEVANSPAPTDPNATPAKPHYSRPVFRQSLTVNSLQAQRVMERSFEQVSFAFFSLDVILRIIGDQSDIDQVDQVIQELRERVAEDMQKQLSQLQKMMSDNDIAEVPAYSSPIVYPIEITSPQTAQFARLIKGLDELMAVVDTLWLHGLFTTHQRSNATYEWQQRLIKLAGRIIGMEKRARISAHTKGKSAEVAEVAPEQETKDPELATEAEAEANAEEVSGTIRS